MNRWKKSVVSHDFHRFCVFFNAFLRKNIFSTEFSRAHPPLPDTTLAGVGALKALSRTRLERSHPAHNACRAYGCG